MPTERQPLLCELVPTSADRGCCVVSATDPPGRILGFLDRSRYCFFQVTPRLSSRGRVDPVPDPLPLRKSGSAGNRTQDLWICSQKLISSLKVLSTVYCDIDKESCHTPAKNGYLCMSFVHTHIYIYIFVCVPRMPKLLMRKGIPSCVAGCLNTAVRAYPTCRSNTCGCAPKM
jgi:hypothetical protein